MPIKNTREAFLYDLRDAYDAEHELVKGYEEMHKQASDQKLKQMIEQHMNTTKQQQVKNLEQVFKQLGESPSRVTCDAAKGLKSEAQAAMKEAQGPEIRDVMIAAAASEAEFYEIASYRNLVTAAEFMGEKQVHDLLQQNLQQEQQMSQDLGQTMWDLLGKAPKPEPKTEKVEEVEVVEVLPVEVVDVDQKVVQE